MELIRIFDFWFYDFLGVFWFFVEDILYFVS